MNDNVVLMIHGHMGRRKQFEKIIPLVSCENVFNIVLPGHEGTLDNFVSTRYEDWQRMVDDTIESLQKEYKRVIIVGHSMGGLLAINSVVMRKYAGVAAIFAIELPLKLKITLRALRYRIKAICPASDNDSDELAAAVDMCGVSGITLWNSVRLIPNTFELMRVIRSVNRNIAHLTVPLTIINSSNDEIVSKRSLLIAKHALSSCNMVKLHESSHFYFSDKEIKLIADAVNSSLNVE